MRCLCRIGLEAYFRDWLNRVRNGWRFGGVFWRGFLEFEVEGFSVPEVGDFRWGGAHSA